MRPTLLFVSLPVLLVSAAFCQVESSTPRPAATVSRMTLDLNETPLRRALDLVLAGTGMSYTLEEGIPDVPVTVNLQDVPLRTAIKRIVANAASQVSGLTVDLKETPWRIVRGAPTAGQFRGPRTRVALDVYDVPLREAIDRVFADTDSYCVVDANVPDVPVSLRFEGVTLHSGACLITGAAWEKGVPVTLKRSGPNYELALAKVGPAYTEASRNLTGPKARSRSDLKLYYMPLRKAVRTIPAKPGTQLLVEHNVPDVRLRMRMRNLSTQAAVSQLVAVASLRAPGVSYVKSGNVYVIYRPSSSVRETRTTASQ